MEVPLCMMRNQMEQWKREIPHVLSEQSAHALEAARAAAVRERKEQTAAQAVEDDDPADEMSPGPPVAPEDALAEAIEKECIVEHFVGYARHMMKTQHLKALLGESYVSRGSKKAHAAQTVVCVKWRGHGRSETSLESAERHGGTVPGDVLDLESSNWERLGAAERRARCCADLPKGVTSLPAPP